MAYIFGISESKPGLKVSPVTEEEINDFRIVTHGSADGKIVLCTNATTKPLGVTQKASDIHSTETYEIDQAVDTVLSGIVYVKMSGSGNAGDSVVATTGGMGAQMAFGSSDQWCIGSALQSWTDEQVIPVKIELHYIGSSVSS